MQYSIEFGYKDTDFLGLFWGESRHNGDGKTLSDYMTFQASLVRVWHPSVYGYKVDGLFSCGKIYLFSSDMKKILKKIVFILF